MIIHKVKLKGLHEDLIRLIKKVGEKYDLIILEGLRSYETQEKYFKTGKSKTLKSKHLIGKAVDMCPYPIPENWGEKKIKEKFKFYFFCGYVLAKAEEMKIKIRLGADWNGDKNFRDQNFDDLLHVELLT